MRPKFPKLKLVRIPIENRGELSKNLAIHAADLVFKPLFFTLSRQKPTASVSRAAFFLAKAYESYVGVIHETYDRTSAPSETILETSQRFN